MATAEDIVRSNPFSGILEMLGLPTPDEIIPTPESITEMTGIPSIPDIINMSKT